MKFLLSALAASALALGVAPVQAATVHHHYHHVHVAHYYHHYRHYGAGYGYGSVAPYPYPPAPYPGYTGLPAVYVPGYFYATPGIDNPNGQYGPYPYSWGYRNTLNLLLNNEGDPPFSE